MTRAKAPSKAKGELLEDVVALLYRAPGVTVETRVQVPVRSSPRETREIDVLVASRISGFQVQFAFECKSYAASIGVAQIGEFRDKLEEIEIPPQLGLYVTTSDYTSGARRRANELGIRLFRL